MTWLLTTSQAAKRVKRTRRTIERWIAAGMPTQKGIGTDGRVRHMINEDVLLEWYRKALLAGPLHLGERSRGARVGKQQ